MGTQLFSSARFFFCNIGWLLLVMMLIPGHALSQVTVSGEVISQENVETLPGVNVLVKGTTTGTSTDQSGNFEIEVPSLQDTLVFSFVGFQTQEVAINERTEIDVVLQSQAITGEELVVTGYTVEVREDITGSVSIVDTDALKRTSATSAEQALQGNAAGVNVRTTGSPGEGSDVHIRGISNFGDTQPLVLVDGVETDMNNVNPKDIESMQVLKDAGAAAIYGVRGANGVIVITTNKGQAGKTQFTYNASVGVQTPLPSNPYNLMNPEEQAQVELMANPDNPLYRDGIPDYFYLGDDGSGFAWENDPEVDPSNYHFDPENPANNYIIQRINKEGTDWYSATHDPAPTTNHNLSVSGGNETATYLFSAEYLNQQGTMLNTHLQRYSVRLNTNFKLMNDNVRIGENIRVFHKDNPLMGSNSGQFSTSAMFYQTPRLVPLFDIEGNYGGTRASTGVGSRNNPYAQRDRAATDESYSWNAIGNVFAEADLLSNLTVRTSLGGDLQSAYGHGFNYVGYENPEGWQGNNGFSESSSYNYQLMWTNTLNYSIDVGNHSITALAGAEAITNKGRSIWGSREEYFSDSPHYTTLSTGTSNLANGSSTYENSVFSLFGDLDYAYDNTYLVGATLRRDGSSRFGEESKHGLFPSFSLGWRISNEGFMNDFEWLDDFRFKGSYGVLGSQNNVSSDNQFDLYGGGFGDAYYPIGGGPGLAQGFYNQRIGNPRTSWERNIITNIGFDLTIFEDVNVALEYYKKEIDGLLFPQPLPATVGGATSPTVNIGDIQNTGLDLTASYNGQISQGLQFTIGGNITTYNNTVVDVPDPGYFDTGGHQQLGNTVRNEEGQPVSSYFGYDVVGLFQNPDDVASSPIQQDAAPGRFKFRDVDGDGEITSDDRTFIGNPNPDFSTGFNIEVFYRHFDLSTNIFGSYGADVVNTTRVYTDFLGVYPGAKSKRLLNSWTPENTDTNVPIVENAGSFSTTATMNSYYVEDGSYLRMQSLVLGYTLPSSITQQFGISNFRLYAQARNLFTVTNYSGLDPEIGGGSAGFGIDYGTYPSNERSFTLGIDLEF